MAASCEELPDEIWELILNGLGSDHHSEFESLSLVSKRLLSLTDRLRLRFTVVDQTYFIYGTISRFLYRFKHLKTLDLSQLNHCYLETALREIARSSVALNLEELDVSNHESIPIDSLKELGLSNNRKLKVLKCANVTRLRDDDLIAIAKFYPDLEELDVSYPRHKFTIPEFRSCNISELMITDAGIEVLSSGLKNLIKIDISMNHLLTDNSVFYLSTNCLRLQEISLIDCTLISMKGVRFMLHNSRNLRTISMCFVSNIHGTHSLFMNPETSGRSLSSLHFRDSDFSDEFLNSIAKANIPLKRISLSSCTGYTVNGISSLLYAYQSLEFLDLTRNNFLCDKSVIALSQYLRDLVSVKLNFCRKLTSTTVYTLIDTCSFLEHIEMKHTNLGKEEDTVMDFVKHPNPSIKSLNLSGNLYLTDACLVKITSVCPNLTLLDVSSCPGVSGSSLGEILRCCKEIRHLSIQDCGRVKNIGLNMEPLKLKKLYMARSVVNDEGLLEIGVRCKDLVKIDLSGCLHVTTSAVNYLVRKCEKLREVNLMGCLNLHVFIVDSMVYARPSLRKLIPPSYGVTSERQRRLLLKHGCHVCDK